MREDINKKKGKIPSFISVILENAGRLLSIIVSLFKVVLRITHSSRSTFMFLLPVVLKQLRLLFNREQSLLHTTCAALKLTCVDLQHVVPSNGKTWGINHNGSSKICLTGPSQLGFAGC